MSGTDVKKPETREEFIKILTEAAKKESDRKISRQNRQLSEPQKKWTFIRDTLYTWLKEFNVDFKEIVDRVPTVVADRPLRIQEALT